MAVAAIFKIRKIAYLCNGTTDFDEIWYSYASGPSRHRQRIKFCKFDNPRWRRPPSWKIEKKLNIFVATERPILTTFSTWWVWAFQTLSANEISQIWKSQMAAAAMLKAGKILVSKSTVYNRRQSALWLVYLRLLGGITVVLLLLARVATLWCRAGYTLGFATHF